MSKIRNLIKELCPKGVQYIKLKNICSTLKKGTLKTTDLKETGYPVINSGRNLYGYYNEYNNEANAFTVAARGEYAGYINYFNEKFWAGGLCYPYKSTNEAIVKTKFIYYFLKSIEKHIRKEIVIDGSIPALNKSDLEKIMIPIPPMKIQEKIIEILDKYVKLEAELELDLKDELKMRRREYEFYRNKIFSFENYKGIVKNVSILEYAESFTGLTYRPENKTTDGSGMLVLRSSNIQNNTLDFNDSVRVNMISIPERTLVKNHDTLICVRNGSKSLVGKAAYIDNLTEPMAFGAFMSVLRSKDSGILDEKYLFYVWQYAYDKIRQHSDDSMVINQITQKDFDKITIPVPTDINKQKSIVSFLDKLDESTAAIFLALSNEIQLRKQQYEYYRNKLLDFKEV